MSIASAMAKFNMKQPNQNSKTQKEKSEKLKANPTKYIACNNCHRDNITLIRCTDSYYCKQCMHELNKQKYVKGK